MTTSPDLKGALEAMKSASRGPRRKSPVYEWLAAKHDALATAFRTSQPSWKALAEYLGNGGVMGADGVPATPAAVRSTWLRVQADRARKRQPGNRAPSLTPLPVVQPSAGAHNDELETDQPDEPDFNTFVKER